MKVSLNQAVKQVKVAKATLSRALNSGELSGTKTDKGQWEIEVAELSRWNSTRSKKPRSNKNEVRLESPQEHPKKPPESSDLELQLKAMEQDKIAMLERRIDDLQTERDEWRKQAQQLALAAPSPENTSMPAAKGRGGFFSRLIGK